MKMSENKITNTKKIAAGGVMAALCVVSLIIAAVLPINKLSLYTLSSFFVSVFVIEYGLKAGWIFYIATSLLSVIIVPDKLAIVPYLIFFGLYGIIKYYIEKLDSILVEYVLKYIYFNAAAGLAYLFASRVIMAEIDIGYALWIVIIVLEVLFFIYDYVYTLFIKYYNEKIKKILRI
jgi:hypothetical protein